MMFWIGILVSAIFARSAIKLGFYQTWALLFNIIISIYLGLYLQPVIANIPAVGGTPYSNVLATAAVAIAAFLILHGISYTFFTGQFNVSFPKVFDTLGTGLLGFLAGFLIWSFLSLLIYITPVSQNSLIKEIGFTNAFQQTSASYVSRFCNLVNAVVSSKDNKLSAEQTIDKMLNDAKSKFQRKTRQKPEPAESDKTQKDVKTGNADQNLPGPPPEIDIDDI